MSESRRALDDLLHVCEGVLEAWRTSNNDAGLPRAVAEMATVYDEIKEALDAGAERQDEGDR